MNAKQLQQLKASLISQLDTVTRELETHADSAAQCMSIITRGQITDNLAVAQDRLIMEE